MTRAEKNLCFSLASKSYAYIPSCDTEKSCFEKVNPLFTSSLNPAQESSLYEMKNHIARSWFFYNKAVKEIETISKLCNQGNSSVISGNINQTRFYMNSAFLELDLGMKKSFDIIFAEESLLDGEEVDLVKEEPLYESLVEYRQAISELNTGSTNSDTYVSFYLKKAEAFSKSTAAKGFPALAEKEVYWVEGVYYSEKAVLKEIGVGSEAYFPFLESSFGSAFAYLENTFFTRQSLSALQNFPAQEFMKIYSDLGGESNSALKRFSDLINKTGNNLALAKSNKTSLWAEIENKLAKSALLSKQVNDSNSYEWLYSKLINSVTGSTTQNPIGLAKITSSIIKLKERRGSASLSLGEELSELKKINNELDEFIWGATINLGLYSDALSAACDTRAEKVKEIRLDVADSGLESALLDLKLMGSKTLSENAPGKFSFCAEMIKQEDFFDSALNDKSLLIARQKDLSKECFSFLEQITQTEEFNELKSDFEALKKTEVDSSNLGGFLKSCDNLKSRAQALVNKDSILGELENSFSQLKGLKNELSIMSPYFDSSFDEKLTGVKLRLADFSKYFNSDGSAKIESVFNARNLVLDSMKGVVEETNEFIDQKVIEYFSNSQKVFVFGEQPLLAGEDKNMPAIISFENPFRVVIRDFYVLPKEPFFGIEKKDDCVKGIIIGGEGRIIFSCAPSGRTQFTGYTKASFSIEETENVLLASNEESVVRREIKIISNNSIANARILTKKPRNTQKTVVIVDGTEINSLEEGGNILINLTNAKANTLVFCFFYVNSLIEALSSFKETRSEVFGETLIYELKAKNTYPASIEATIVFSSPFSSKINSVNVMESFSIKKAEIIGGNIVLKKESFLAGEEKSYLIELGVGSAEDYYISALLEQKKFFEQNGEQEKADKIGLAIELGGETVQQLAGLFESNSKLIEQIKKNQLDASNASLLNSGVLSKLDELLVLKNQLEEIGLTGAAGKINELLQSVSGRTSFSDDEAKKLLVNISQLSFVINEEMKKDIESWWTAIQKLAKTSGDENILSAKESIFNLREGFLADSVFDPKKAQEEYLKIKTVYADAVDYNKIMGEKLALVEKVAETELEKQVTECNSLIEWLSENVVKKSVQLTQAGVILSINSTGLESKRLELSKIISSSKKNSEKLAEIKALKHELTDAVSSIKRQAVSAFNSALDLGLQKSVLLEAKSFIDSNRPTDALLFLSSNTQSDFSGLVSYAFLPIVLIILVAFVIKRSVKKKEMKEGEKKKIILQDWEKD